MLTAYVVSNGGVVSGSGQELETVACALITQQVFPSLTKLDSGISSRENVSVSTNVISNSLYVSDFDFLAPTLISDRIISS